jgi:hypothetical protein
MCAYLIKIVPVQKAYLCFTEVKLKRNSAIFYDFRLKIYFENNNGKMSHLKK